MPKSSPDRPRIRPLGAEIASHPDRRRVVWRQFLALFENVPDSGLAVEIEVAIDDSGKPACVSVQVQPREQGPRITGELLGRVPVARLMKAALDAAARQVVVEPPTGPTTEKFLAQLPGHGLQRRRKDQLTDEDLKRVAAAYRAAVKQGLSTKRIVAEAMGRSEPTAARYIRQARDRGLLDPGRAGEQEKS